MNNESALLDATIEYLKSLKSQGKRFVNADTALLKRLAQPVARASEITNRSTIATPAPKPAPTSTPGLPSPALRAAAPATAPVALFGFATEASNGTDAASRPVLDPAAKAAAMAELRARALACVKCPNLAAARKNVAFGVGDTNAELMFVGEAPGADEDVQGEPFVGAAGQLLTKIIQTMGLSRQQVYIGNILKCRPDTPGQASGNRKPTTEEMATCIPYLHEQIDLIRPKVLVALGATAVEGLLGKTIGITKLRGNWKTYRGIPLMPTYHPAYLLRNQALAEKRRVWEDMLAVMAKLGMAISEKQQSYFLSR